MKKILLSILFFSFAFIKTLEQNFDFKFKGKKHTLTISQYTLTNYEFQLSSIEDVIGYLKCDNQSGVNDFFISNIFIKPEYRNCKYGELLIFFAIKYLVKFKNAKTIELCPSPFELTGEEYQERKKYLYKYYSKFGFVRQQNGHMQLKSKL